MQLPCLQTFPFGQYVLFDETSHSIYRASTSYTVVVSVDVLIISEVVVDTAEGDVAEVVVAVVTDTEFPLDDTSLDFSHIF